MSADVWHVYQHLGRNDAILYVGCSKQLAKRTEQHRRLAEWWGDVRVVECIAEFDDRRLALDFESMRILQTNAPNNWFHRRHDGDLDVSGRIDWAAQIAAQRGDCWLLFRDVRDQAISLESHRYPVRTPARVSA